MVPTVNSSRAPNAAHGEARGGSKGKGGLDTSKETRAINKLPSLMSFPREEGLPRGGGGAS